MNTISHDRIIGIDVSRDWLDIHCLPDGHHLRLPNTGYGHERLADIATTPDTVVCFEATGGQEWRLWTTLDAAGVRTRLGIAHVPRDQGDPGTNVRDILRFSGTEIIQHADLLALLDQAADEMRADEAGTARYEVVTRHLSSLP